VLISKQSPRHVYTIQIRIPHKRKKAHTISASSVRNLIKMQNENENFPMPSYSLFSALTLSVFDIRMQDVNASPAIAMPTNAMGNQ